MPDELQEITVQSLIDVETNSWDYDILNDICNSRDKELIKRIPIPMREREDSWFWILDDKGQFIVKSCYRQLQGEQNNTHASFWKRLWSLQLPGKVINFLWRVCRGCLPTAQALVMKQVNISVYCPWCHKDRESDIHVLFKCDFARNVWLGTGLQHLLQVLPDDTCFDVLVRVFSLSTREKNIPIEMVCWALWNRRNKWVWDRANGSAFEVRAAAVNMLNDWRTARVDDMKSSRQVEPCARR